FRKEEEEGVPGEFGKVCHIKKQRRKRQKLLIIDLFFDFAKNTTLHGLRYITEVGLTVIEKVFWVLTFLASVILCFMLIERVWHKWWYSPVIVSFNEKMVPVGEVPFPSITICPQWKCKTSAYNYTDKQIKHRWGKPKNMSEIDDETYSNERILLEDAYLIAPKLDEAMYSCRWRGTYSSCKRYFTEVLTREGVCFNFNALAYKDIFKTESIQHDYKYLNSTTPINKWDIISGYTTSENVTEKKKEYPRRGRENGANPDLEIMLLEDSADIDDSCNSLSNGWKIYLQHPADLPQSSLYYYAAIAKQVTSLALKFSILNTSESLINYKPEQRQCYFPKDRDLKYFAMYTPDNCQLECLSLYTYEKCKCVWFHMPHNNGSEICTASQQTCVENAQDELASNNLKYGKCNCLPSCDSVHYDAEILKTEFDLQKYNNSIKMIHNRTLQDNRRYSRLEIYFKEPRFVSMRRSELFGLTDFLANCGGLLGLFLGFSFLSFVEIFYFCTLRLWCTLKNDMKNEKKKLKESVYKK
ncbi:pickpocket protein 28-like, partial [Cydia amplana]|uniref:pickpocket protein 28-like n=1 Tax=Cydia amplana TaxID=1869771 RepID=UPI002FE5049E